MSHQPVLLNEVIAALNIKPEGLYLDATFGRGGHARLLLSRLNDKGQLIVCDQDSEAIRMAFEWSEHDKRITPVHANFRALAEILESHDWWGQIDGILFDLGVSSPQLDEAERGFSFMRDGPLDMRMNQAEGLPLFQKWETLNIKELTLILRDYGEERFAAKISEAILKEQPSRTTELATLIANVIPRKFHEPHKHPATRTFQALRIWVNAELESLETALAFFPEILAPAGRAVFISFHSLEDRLVKTRMRSLTEPPTLPRGLPVAAEALAKPVMRICVKMQKPTLEEIAENPRARSAVLRAYERVNIM